MRVGFEWSTAAGIANKVNEELQEFLVEVAPPDKADSQDPAAQERVVEEFGDLLFTLAQYSRKLGFNAETALAAANEKFMKRFKYLEGLARSEHLETPLGEIGQEILEKLWVRAKIATR